MGAGHVCTHPPFASRIIRQLANNATARRVARRVGRRIGNALTSNPFPTAHEENVRVTKTFRYFLTDQSYSTWNFTMRDLLDSWVTGQTATSAIRVCSAAMLKKVTLRVPPSTFSSTAAAQITPVRFIWQPYSFSDPDGNRTLSYDIVPYGTSDPVVFSSAPPPGSLIEGWINSTYTGAGQMFTIDQAPINSMLELTISYILATGGVGAAFQPGQAAIAGANPGYMYVRTLPASSTAWVPIGYATL